VDDLESPRDALWLSEERLREDIAEARHDMEAGQAIGAGDLRAEFGLAE